MQITLDKDEVSKIILDAINDKFLHSASTFKFNSVRFNSSYSAEFCEVTREEKDGKNEQ